MYPRWLSGPLKRPSPVFSAMRLPAQAHSPLSTLRRSRRRRLGCTLAARSCWSLCLLCWWRRGKFSSNPPLATYETPIRHANKTCPAMCFQVPRVECLWRTKATRAEKRLQSIHSPSYAKFRRAATREVIPWCRPKWAELLLLQARKIKLNCKGSPFNSNLGHRDPGIDGIII